MTQEEKELLFQDICARLPYHPKIQIYFEDIAGSGTFDEKLTDISYDDMLVNDRHIDDIKPYLRPMSSMTSKEKEFYESMFMNVDGHNLSLFPSVTINWLDKNMFDYHGLIPMGLALPAKEGMYN